jgi:ABC-type uncharacterized transport system permease subunit
VTELLEPLLAATVRISVPILLAVIGEIVVERSGVLNVGLEGMMLAGAFGGFAGASLTGNAGVGVLLGAACGVLSAALFALLVVRFDQDAIVVGIALNLLAIGVTGVLHRAMADATSFASRVTSLAPVPIPVLSSIPIIGPAFFSHHVLSHVAFVLTGVVAWFLASTTRGLVLRASGENPEAVETSGIDVRAVRTGAILFGGLLAGLAGVALSIGYSDTFVESMTAGRGFVALALVVLARWNPIAGLGGSLLFGLATAFQVRFQGDRVIGVEIPYHFLQMLPYALTLVVLALTAREGARAPAALGRPYVRGRS